MRRLIRWFKALRRERKRERMKQRMLDQLEIPFPQSKDSKGREADR